VPVADHRQHRRAGGLAHAVQLHQLEGSRVLAGNDPDVPVVLRDAFVQAVQLAQRVADRRVGAAGKLFELSDGLPSNRCGLQRQHEAELGSSDFTGTKRMFCRCTASQIAAASAASFLPRAAHAVWRHELRRHQPHRVGMRLQQPRPVVRAAAGFHSHRARRQRGDQMQPGARHRRTHQQGLALLIHPCTANTILARSVPTNTIAMDFHFRR